MIDLPLKAEVLCSDSVAGLSTYVVGNPMNDQMTYLVVQDFLPPYREFLVPVELVEETNPHMILLRCTRQEFERMKPLEFEETIQAVCPTYLSLPYYYPTQLYKGEIVSYTPIKYSNVPPGEKAVWHGAKVEATDGYIGQVEEVLIDSNTLHATHLVLREGHKFDPREITIPISQIKRIVGDTIYLKLDRKSIKELPTAPIQRWQLQEELENDGSEMKLEQE